MTRIAVLSYGSLVKLPYSTITKHDVNVKLPFCQAGFTVPARLGMSAYNTKLTTCISNDNEVVEVAVYFAESLNTDLAAAIHDLAAREGCSEDLIGKIYKDRFEISACPHVIAKRIQAWLQTQYYFDVAIFADFRCSLTASEASDMYATMDEETTDYGLHRVPQPGGKDLLRNLCHNRKWCKHHF